MRFLHHSVALLGFLADREQAHRGIAPPEEVLRVHGAEPRELHEFLRRAVDIRPGIQHHHQLARRREERADGRACQAIVQPKDERGRGHLGAGISRGHERIRLAVRLQAQPDDHGTALLPTNRDRGFVGHLDNVVRVHEMHAFGESGVRRSRACLARKFGANDLLAPNELQRMLAAQLLHGQQRPGHRGLGCMIPTHRVERDACQGQASFAAIRCLPA